MADVLSQEEIDALLSATDGDEGEWHDNPFGLRKCVSVELAWD